MPAHPLAVSVSVEGEQTDRLVGGVIVGALGLAFISKPVTAVLASEVQPFTVQVAETLYVPTADMVKLVPVAAPCDHVTVPAHPLAVSVNVEGEQTIKVLGGVILGAAGLAFISKPITAVLASEVQPFTVQVAEML